MSTSIQSNSFKWYTVMTFNENEQFIMNEISFDHLGKAIENYDLQGFEIVGTGLSWKSTLALAKCDKTVRNCDKYGITVDLMTDIAEQYNITWDVYKDFPVEGR